MSKVLIQSIYISIAGNLLLGVVKWVCGYLGNSYAMIADAIESSMDVLSSLLVLVGMRYAVRPPDANHPYGHGRAEALLTFIVVGFLGGSAAIIAYQSIHNIQQPHDLPKAFTLPVLGGIILLKEIVYRLLKHRSGDSNSTAMNAEAWHHRADAITSILAFIGISTALILGPGYEAADDWAALLASLVILYNGYKLLRPALGELMDEDMHTDLIAEIREAAQDVEGIVTTEKCLIRKAGLRFYVDLHAVVDADITVFQGHEIAHRLKERLMLLFPHIADVLVHVEPDRKSRHRKSNAN